MDYFWRMKNGEEINVDDMSEEHLRNTLKMIIRNTQTKKPKKPINHEWSDEVIDQCSPKDNFIDFDPFDEISDFDIWL